jgi:hypothetical protein
MTSALLLVSDLLGFLVRDLAKKTENKTFSLLYLD